MKKLLLSLNLVVCIFSISFAQLDITSITDESTAIQPSNTDFTIGTTTTSTIITLSPSDTAGIVTSMGEIIASPDGENDTIQVQVLITVRNTPAIDNGVLRMSTSSSDVSISFDNLNEDDGTRTSKNLFFNGIKFVEDSYDTLRIINESTSETIQFFVSIAINQNSVQHSIISNTLGSLLEEGNVSITNPVNSGRLIINNIPSWLQPTKLELISLDGEIMMSKMISSINNTMDVSDLKSSLYLLIDKNSGVTRKIMIN